MRIRIFNKKKMSKIGIAAFDISEKLGLALLFLRCRKQDII